MPEESGGRKVIWSENMVNISKDRNQNSVSMNENQQP